MIESLLPISSVDIAGLSTATLFAVLFFATFVSEDAACIAAGALASSGEISFAAAVFACFAGIVTGDIGLYWIGRVFGRHLLGFEFAKRFVTNDSLDRASAWLERRGASAVFLSRFVTGLRLPTYLAAGFLRTNFWRFAFFFVLAAAVWTPLLVGSVAISGELYNGSILISAMVVFIAARVVLRTTNRQNRRITIGKLKRVFRWEFWPLPIFYFPVVCYVALLAIRHRSLTVFTCANPAIASGGFVGESKDAIYRLIGSAKGNDEFLLRHRLIAGNLAPQTKLRYAEDFMSAFGLQFPVVVKPDVGERGKGVRIVRTRHELERALADSEVDVIIQEYFDGDEVSVFYYQRPGAERGTIFSMTEKMFPAVTGDGMSSLEQLILRDDRAVCLAKKYFEANRHRLDHVPAKDEIVALIDIGTHSRGAIFRDGSHLRTHAMEMAIDEICRHIDGFYFGRFDIRYSSEDEFRNGRGFKIIELNGASSESTNIYDPRYTLINAYRILFAQWRICFEIGAANRSRGARSTRISSLIRPALSAISVT